MTPYKIIKQLDCSKDLNPHIALKFDAGKVKSEKYGEATLSGSLLFLNRQGEFPKVHLKQIEERANGWLKEIGLEEYRDYMCEKINLPSMIAYTAPGVDPDKLGYYFQISAVYFLLDDLLVKLSNLNANDAIKNQVDVLTIVKSLISILESKGDANIAEVAAYTNPMFKDVYLGFAFVWRHNYQQLDENEYALLASATADYFRVSKWEQEYRVSPYNENDYLFIRSINVAMYPMVTQICIAKGIHISNEVRMHPLLQKFYKNVILHVALSNDVLSLQKELADNEKENFVLVKCRKYSLQKSIHKTVRAVNKLIIDLKKDKAKLMSYFPDDLSLKNFIETLEGVNDGNFYWYPHSKRYGIIKFEKYVVEYDCDYKNWLEEIGIVNIENMREPVCRV